MELYIYNGAKDEHIQREYTVEELAIREKEIANFEAARLSKQTEAEAKAQAKAQAEAKLSALGLTTDDLRALGL